MTTTTRLSSKGQVVIPADVRRALGWRPGDRLTVELRQNGDRALVLRARPSPEEIEAMLARGYAWFEQNRVDPVEALHRSRRLARVRERQLRDRRRR